MRGKYPFKSTKVLFNHLQGRLGLVTVNNFFKWAALGVVHRQIGTVNNFCEVPSKLLVYFLIDDYSIDASITHGENALLQWIGTTIGLFV